MQSVVFFSDTQLIPQGRVNFDLDPAVRLRACIDSINKECPESSFCLIAGDLSHWGEALAYEVLKRELSHLQMPCYLLMGNHDRRDNFLNVFPEHPVHPSGFIQYALDLGDTRIICLDTLEPGHRGGFLCQNRLEWLESQLANSEKILLFMHHPPFKVGLPSMDEDCLANGEELSDLLIPYKKNIQHLFFGHIHRSISGVWKEIGFSCPLSLVHQTPFDFADPKPNYISMEAPQYCKVMVYEDRVIVHHREFLQESGIAMPNRGRKRYPNPNP